MKTPVIKATSTLSGSGLYRKIMNKHQTGKTKILRFPILIFYKNGGYFPHKNIDMNILLKINFFNQKILLPFVLETVPIMKGLQSWLDREKQTLQSTSKSKNINSVRNVKNFFTSNDAFNQQITHITHSNNIMANPQILDYENKMKILNFQAFRVRLNCQKNHLLDAMKYSTSVDKEGTHKYRSTSSVVLSQDNLFFNSTLKEINQLLFKYINQVIVVKPSIRNYYGSFRPASSSFDQRTYAYKAGDHSKQSDLRAILSRENLFFNCGLLEINKLLSKDLNQVTVNEPLLKKYYYSLRCCPSSLAYKISTYKSEYYGNQSKLSSNLSKYNLFFKSKILEVNKLLFKYLNDITVNRLLIKNNYYSFGPRSSGSLNRTYAYKTNSYGNRSKLPETLPNDNLFFDSTILRINKFSFKDINQITINGSPIKNNYDIFRHISPNSAKWTYAYEKENEIMRFHDHGNLKQEIEQIKNIIIQTKESISEKTKPSLGEAEIRRYIDINQISDQVYQNIERTIRMERERRGM